MIYLDHNATSPLLDEAREAMAPWLGVPANPASTHRAGQRAAAAVEEARAQVAALVGGRPEGVVFTSGATEANHLFLRGVVRRGARQRLVLGALEHPCVHAAAREAGVPITTWPAGPDGRVQAGEVPEDTAAVALMAANHETGVVQPWEHALRAARAAGAALHVDATQAAGRVALDLREVDGVALSAHKLGGPSGVGALLLRDGEPFPPLLTGGAQERGRRAGTVNVAGVVGFAAACRAARRELAARALRLQALSDRLRDGVVALGGRVVGAREALLPNTTCVVFEGVQGEAVVLALDLRGVCVSSGAACASGSLAPSPVLTAMGDPEPAGAVRFSLGPSTTESEITRALAALAQVVEALRSAEAW